MADISLGAIRTEARRSGLGRLLRRAGRILFASTKPLDAMPVNRRDAEFAAWRALEHGYEVYAPTHPLLSPFEKL